MRLFLWRGLYSKKDKNQAYYKKSWNCCSICAQYNGKVVDINKGGYDLPPYHPNCRGTIVPVWEKGIEDSNFQNIVKSLDQYAQGQLKYSKPSYKEPYKQALSTLSAINSKLTKGKGKEKSDFDLRAYKIKSKALQEVMKEIDQGNIKDASYKWYRDPKVAMPTIQIKIEKKYRRYHSDRKQHFVPKGKLEISPRRRKK